MKQVLPLFLHASENTYRSDDTSPLYTFHVWPMDMSSTGYIPLGRTDFEFDIPSHEQIVARHAVLLREKIKEVHNEAGKKVADLREQLSKLESLTYEVKS
jgi:hypothetical protein